MKTLEYYLKLNYPFNVSQDSDGTFFVEYPDLKGCFTCSDNINEAILMANNAKVAWLETAIENNISIPVPKSTDDYSGNIKLRVPKSLHQSLSQQAKQEGISMNQYCVYLLSKELSKESYQHS